MVADEKITSFLRLQQMISDLKDSTKLLEQILPKVLEELNILGYPYIFLSAIFVDTHQKIQQTFFIDHDNYKMSGVTKLENIFQKGSEWEMKVMYGEAAIVSDIAYLINPSYPKYPKIKSLLILPIQHQTQLAGVLILASSKQADQIDREEIEFGEMITRLIDLAFRLQDTESSLIKITQQVYEMNAKLHQVDKLKDDFVSVASHELRTPMTAIRSYAWMALHKSDVPLSDKLERYLVRVLMSTERLINLVNDMLNISRIESGKIEINPEPVDLVELAKDIVDEVYYSKSTEKNIHFYILDKPIPKAIADPEKLREVLLNLVGNSLKFTPDEGKIIFDFFSDGLTVEVSVKDNGVGISKEDLGRLFQKFSRLDSSYVATASSGGTGLGLFISKSLIELMHGRIWVSSEGLGKGATVTVALPVASKERIEHISEYATHAQGEVKQLETVAI